ncbi:tyrosine-type recombinase/integrase [Haloferax sp. MBLA0076]|uniref:Tyrosine-type recombinase/integrase n=1 Tax=Haloferax litoreum TaxID=2666140 RepID=A0A6A8GFQ3_9EURY|nr:MULTISPECIES: site-specific integrase [Haloferax]KAB1193466.1 site-specific integrase [Haloferax sp. CBA1148]MRX21978.1 tyrosine-type recombinase/integrase [Haloferax litoreum]
MNSKTQQEEERIQVWMKPEQIDELRNATVEISQPYLSGRNDALIALMADTGLRVSEAVHIETEMIDFDDGVLRIPSHIQKQPPEGQRPPAALSLAPETLRTLRTYLNSRWKDSDYLFPSRQSERMTTETARNIIEDAALEADIRPYRGVGRGEPKDVTPHTLRHSVAYRLLAREDEGIYKVKSRLRHSSVTTTESIYTHLDVA